MFAGNLAERPNAYSPRGATALAQQSFSHPIDQPALFGIGLSFALLSFVAEAVVAAGPLSSIYLAYLFPVVGALYAIAGGVAWWRRPANRLGPLLVAGGSTFVLVGMANTGVPWLIAAGTITATLPLAVMIHLVHACPNGVLQGRATKLTVAGAYFVGLVLQAPIWAFTPEPRPFDVVEIVGKPHWAHVGLDVQEGFGLLVVAATVVLLILRIRDYEPANRRILAPLLGYSVLAVLAVPLGGDVLRPLGIGENGVALQDVAVCIVPFALLVLVLRGGFARTGQLDEFLESVAGVATDSSGELESAVAITLGDESAKLYRWEPGQEAYVDHSGQVAEVAQESHRSVIRIEADSGHLGVIHYDAYLGTDAAAVAAVGRVVAIALDRDRLARDVTAHERLLSEASRRLLDDSDRQRRQIVQDLHDGLQVDLVRISMQAHALAQQTSDNVVTSSQSLASDVDAAAAKLRSLVHGVMPSPLIERGLVAAIKELASSLPVRVAVRVEGVDRRFPAPIETTAYFVVAEGLTNAIKHAAAQQIEVRLQMDRHGLGIEVVDDGRGGARVSPSGSGLAGLQDRLSVLGGQLEVTAGDSSRGSRLGARLPCASS